MARNTTDYASKLTTIITLIKIVSCKRCLYSDCGSSFTERGQWSVHTEESRHDVIIERSFLRTEDFRPICCLSAEMESVLTEKIVELRRLNDKFEQEFEKLRKAYVQG
jgi:hypothetical protein